MQSQPAYLSFLISGGPWWRKVPSQRRARSKYQAPNSCIHAPVAWGPDWATPGSDQRMLKKLPVWPVSRSAPWEATLIREKNSAPSRFAEQVEHDGGHPALAVVLVGLDPGVVVAVGDRPLADVEAKQSALRSIASLTSGSLTPASRARISEMVSGRPGAFIIP